MRQIKKNEFRQSDSTMYVLNAMLFTSSSMLINHYFKNLFLFSHYVVLSSFFFFTIIISGWGASLMAQVVKNPALQETQI